MSAETEPIPPTNAHIERMGLNNFDWKSFTINMIIYLFFFCLSIFSHRQFILKSCKIKMYNLYLRKNVEIKGLRDYIAQSSEIWFVFVRNSRLRLLFIRKYGMEVFNFLNLEVKFALMSATNCLLIIFTAWFYSAFANVVINPSDFMFGTFNFANHRGLCITFAVLCSVNVYVWIFLVSQNLKSVYTQLFIHKLDAKSQIYLIPSAVYLSNISTKTRKQELEDAIVSTTKIPKEEFSLILYPKIGALVRKKVRIEAADEEIIRLSEKRTAENDAEVTAKIEKLQADIAHENQRYKEELSKKVSYTGRGVILFYSVKYLQQFYQYSVRLKVKFESQAERADEAQYQEELAAEKAAGPGAQETKSLTTPLIVGDKTIVKRIRKHFMFTFLDIIEQNIDVSAKLYLFVRVLLYAVVGFVVLFLTTPMSMIQALTNVMFKDREDQSPTARVQLPESVELLLRIIYPFVIYATNLILLKTVEEVGKLQRLTRHSQYQCYVLRLDFIVLMINMLIIPAFSIGAAKSLFASFISNELDISHLMVNLRLYESSNVLCLIILQNIVTSYISSINNTSDLYGTNFDYRAQMRNMKRNRTKHFHQKADDTFEFGYNYSSDTTCLYISFIFGIYQPILFLIMTTYYVIVGIGNIGCIGGYFKRQFSARTRMADMILNRAKWIVTFCFAILCLKLYVLGDTFYYPLCLAIAVVTGVFNFMHKFKSFDLPDLFIPSNYTKFGELTRPRCAVQREAAKRRDEGVLLQQLH